jgi:signal transduction histidine kinase/ActR/RegA family two-component response regulator
MRKVGKLHNRVNRGPVEGKAARLGRRQLQTQEQNWRRKAAATEMDPRQPKRKTAPLKTKGAVSAEVELRTDLKVGDYKSNPTLAWRTKVGGTDGPFEREAHDEYALTLVTSMLRWVRSLLGRAVSDLVRGVPARLRLRTKLLFSFVLMTTCLTSITLLVLRREAQGQVQHQIEQDARNAILTFQTVQRQQQSALARKADLLASLAFMRDGDATAITDAGEDPWQSDDCNLFVLAGKDGGIVALHSTNSSLSTAAQTLVWRSIRRGETAAWWFTGGSLYQVVLQPFYEEPSTKKNLKGTVAVGRLIDGRVAADFARIAASDVAFVYGGEITGSTLGPLKEFYFVQQMRGQSVTTQISLGNEKYYAASLDLTPGVQPSTQLFVLKSYREAEAYLRRLNNLLLGLGLTAIVAGGALIFLISDSVTQPLAALLQGVHALERGNFMYPLKAEGRDELAELTRAFDGMRGTLRRNEAQREQLESQLRQAQKMDALGRLAGGVAHDFNNLLTVIRGHSELLLDRLQPGDTLYRNSEQIRKTSDRAASLTRQMLAFSRMQVLQPKVLDLNELIVEMGKLLRRLVREDIEFSLKLGDSLSRVKADPGQIEQVLLNLTVNASDAMPLGGKLTIETQNIIVDAVYARTRPSVAWGSYAMIGVSDTGQGMDEATKTRIFEPFFTTKEPGKGTGLGLATVYGVVKQSEGFIWVESNPGNGSRFEIYLPQSKERETTGPVSPSASPVVARRETVLVVEDEQEVRELACEFLKCAGYSVVTAENGLEALETAKRFGKSIQLVLTDIVMPKMRGPAMAKQVKSVLPDVKIVYMTGYLEQKDGSDEFLQDAFFLQKPFTRESIVSGVADAMKGERRAQPRGQTVPV